MKYELALLDPYDDPRTYVELRNALGAARCPVHYLAIPPELFPTVIDQLGNVGLAERGRVVVESRLGATWSRPGR